MTVALMMILVLAAHGLAEALTGARFARLPIVNWAPAAQARAVILACEIAHAP